MADRREKEKKAERYNSAKERAEKHERAFDPTALVLPEGVNLFKFKSAKTYRLDHLPYRVKKGAEEAGGNPYCDTDFLHYERTLYTHSIPTADGVRMYCCLQKTFQKKCPVCEEIAHMRRKGSADKDSIDQMDWKERQLFNVVDLDDKDKGVQLFLFNWFQYGKVLDTKAKTKKKYENFFHLVGGRTVEVTVEENQFNGRTSFKPANIEFEERDDYEKDTLDLVHDLDAIPKEMDYDELKKLFLQPGDEEEGDAESNGQEKKKLPSTKPKATAKEEDEEPDDDEEDDEEKAPAKKPAAGKKGEPTTESKGLKKGDLVTYKKMECEILKVSPDGTSLTLEDEDGDVYKAVDPADCKKINGAEDEEEEMATAKPGKKPAAKEEPEEEDEDDSEIDDEDEEEDADEDEEEDKAPVKKPSRRK